MTKKAAFLISSFVCFTSLSSSLFSLPQDPKVVAGEVQFQNQRSNVMVVKASDRAIIDYKAFDIQRGEKVQFVQPSSSSAVLNRVSGGKPTKILGQIESNGKVLLVNPEGMYFGPHSSVRAASLIASSLEIANEDFLKGQYAFRLQNKDHLAEIRNDGLLSSAPEGCIVLMSPVIRNLGTIQAKAGKVVLASGEHVTLDFHGDRLLQFAVEGDLKGAVIEQLGSIRAEEGDVSIKLPTAKRAIHEIINRDGLPEKGEVFVKENGEIFLVSASSIRAKTVDIEGSSLSVDGHIDVSSESGIGGDVILKGSEVSLRGAQIDASGRSGGGNVLVGGDYQGGGTVPYATSVSMDAGSHILANALEEGDGGKVVLWSSQETSFNGNVFAQGGFQSGNGGLVETSSIDALNCSHGYVNTSAPSGDIGKWLLDPSLIEINSVGGTVPSDCNTSRVVDVTNIENALTSVLICADEVRVLVDINMVNSDVGLAFSAPLGRSGILEMGGSIVTKKGAVVVNNMVLNLNSNVLIDTTNGRADPTGADIALQNINGGSSLYSLTLDAGLGLVGIGNVGVDFPLADVSIKGGTLYTGSIFTQSRSIFISCPIILNSDNVVFSTELGGGGNIRLNNVDGLLPGAESFLIAAGNGTVVLGSMGTKTPLGDFSIESAFPLVEIGDIITQNGNINITPSILISQVLTSISSFSEVNAYLSGNITIGDVLSRIPDLQSIKIGSGYKGKVSLGNVGSSDSYIADFLIETNQPFEIGDVYAKDLRITGGSGAVSLLGDITTKADLTINAGKIYLGGSIVSNQVTLDSLNSILNIQGPHPMTANSIFMDAKRGDIGTLASRIEVDSSQPIQAGGRHVYLTGTYPSVSYLPGNKPCLLKFRNSLIPCSIGRKRIFNSQPKATFRIYYFDPVLLGIGYPANYNEKVQYSPFAKISAISGHLPPLERI